MWTTPQRVSLETRVLRGGERSWGQAAPQTQPTGEKKAHRLGSSPRPRPPAHRPRPRPGPPTPRPGPAHPAPRPLPLRAQAPPTRALGPALAQAPPSRTHRRRPCGCTAGPPPGRPRSRCPRGPAKAGRCASASAGRPRSPACTRPTGTTASSRLGGTGAQGSRVQRVTPGSVPGRDGPRGRPGGSARSAGCQGAGVSARVGPRIRA